MNELRSRFQSTFDALAREAENGQSADLMLMFWRSITERENLKYIRLLFEVQVLAIQNPRRYQRYLADTSSSWLRLIGRELRKDKERIAISTLSAAVIDGLTLELLSTGDLPRTSQALRVFIARFHGQASPRSQKNSKKR